MCQDINSFGMSTGKDAILGYRDNFSTVYPGKSIADDGRRRSRVRRPPLHRPPQPRNINNCR